MYLQTQVVVLLDHRDQVGSHAASLVVSVHAASCCPDDGRAVDDPAGDLAVVASDLVLGVHDHL